MQNVLKRKNMYFAKYIFIWACLLHKDIIKLKSCTEENTYLGIAGRISLFLEFLSNILVLDHSGTFDMHFERW